MDLKRSGVGRRARYWASPQSSSRIEWLGGERPREGAAGLASAAWRLLVDAWRWSLWLFGLLISPFVLIGYWWGILLVVGLLCLVLVCIGKPKVALQVIKAIPLVPPNLRAFLVPPRTRFVQRALRAVSRWW